MQRVRSSLIIHDEFRQLLAYIVQLRKLQGPATNGTIVEQLILTYAKQLYAGITSEAWRAELLALINQADEFNTKVFDKRKARYEHLKARAKSSG